MVAARLRNTLPDAAIRPATRTRAPSARCETLPLCAAPRRPHTVSSHNARSRPSQRAVAVATAQHTARRPQATPAEPSLSLRLPPHPPRVSAPAQSGLTRRGHNQACCPHGPTADAARAAISPSKAQPQRLPAQQRVVSFEAPKGSQSTTNRRHIRMFSPLHTPLPHDHHVGARILHGPARSGHPRTST